MAKLDLEGDLGGNNADKHADLVRVLVDFVGTPVEHPGNGTARREVTTELQRRASLEGEGNRQW